MNDLEKLVAWFLSEDVGVSSKSIASVMVGVSFSSICPPADPADFGRCARLLKLFPEWRERLEEMKQYPGWANMVDHWDAIEECMAEEVGIDWSKGQKAPMTYKLMKQIETGS